MKKLHLKRRTGVADRVLYAILFVFLVLYALSLLLMVLWGLNTSLKSNSDFTGVMGADGWIYEPNVMGLPNLNQDESTNSYNQVFKLENFVKIFKEFSVNNAASYRNGAGETVSHHTATMFDMPWLSDEDYKPDLAYFPDMLINTLIYTIMGGLIRSIIPGITAYLCSKYDFKLSKIIFVLYTMMLCMPIVGSFPSEISFLHFTGLYDTFGGNFIQKMSGSGIYFFVYYAYFQTLPDTYREAAEIDGASDWMVLFRIYLPLAIKMMGTVFLIEFVGFWNDFQTPLLYLPTHPTLATGIHNLTMNVRSGTLSQYTVFKMAGCMILAVPLIFLFVIFKDKLMGNVTLGGIKE